MSTHQEASPVFLESQSVVPAPCDLAPPIAKVPVHTPAQASTPQLPRHNTSIYKALGWMGGIE